MLSILKKILFAMVILLLVIIGGCGKTITPDSGPQPNPYSQQPKTGLDKVLIGHWTSVDNSHAYFSENQTYIETNALHEKEKGSFKYSITESDETQNTIKIEIVNTSDNSRRLEILTFSPDRKEFVSTLQGYDLISSKWSYMDNKQKP